MEREHTSKLAEIRDQRGKILAFLKLQEDLWKLLEAQRSERNLSCDEFAKTVDYSLSRDIRSFLERKSALLTAKILQVAAAAIKRNDLRDAITEAIRGIKDRRHVILSASADIVELVFDLREAHLEAIDRYSTKSFMGFFVPYEHIVFRAFLGAADAFQELRNPITRKAIRSLLERGEWKRKNPLRGNPVEGTLNQLRSMVDALLSRYRSKTKLAKALGVHRSTLGNALTGDVSPKTLAMLIGRAKKLQGDATPALPPTPAGEPQPITETHGGETSPLGVRFVLGPQSFREIDGDPASDGVQWGRRVIEMARAALNIFSQLKDQKTRDTVRKALGREVEELELAIRLFTTQHPNRLTSLHEAQRLTWYKEKPITKKPDRRRR